VHAAVLGHEGADLAAQVVSRVREINFGAKEGVRALTIVYPIDFCPRLEGTYQEERSEI
jgi:hypothetical protein